MAIEKFDPNKIDSSQPESPFAKEIQNMTLADVRSLNAASAERSPHDAMHDVLFGSNDDQTPMTAKQWKDYAFKLMDKNEDGKITRREWGPNWREDFALLDDNENGSISKKEWRAQAITFEEFDRNNDKFISKREWIRGKEHPGIFDYTDKNGDGKVSSQEFRHPILPPVSWLE